MEDFISLCVLSYNRPESLKRSLDSLFRNTAGPYELIINDDGSIDPVRDYILSLYRERRVSCIILNNGPNQGVGKSIRNMFEIATGEYLVKLDQDLEYTMNWDRQVVRIMKAFPRIGALGLFHYHHDPVDCDKMFIADIDNAGIRVEVVKDFVGSAIVTPRELYQNIGLGVYSEAFAEDVIYKQKLQAAGFDLAIPKQDLATNFGFGPGPSTVVYREGEEIKVTAITKNPLLLRRG